MNWISASNPVAPADRPAAVGDAQLGRGAELQGVGGDREVPLEPHVHRVVRLAVNHRNPGERRREHERFGVVPGMEAADGEHRVRRVAPAEAEGRAAGQVQRAEQVAVDQHGVEGDGLGGEVDHPEDVDAERKVGAVVVDDVGARTAEHHRPRRPGQLEEDAEVEVHQSGPHRPHRGTDDGAAAMDGEGAVEVGDQGRRVPHRILGSQDPPDRAVGEASAQAVDVDPAVERDEPADAGEGEAEPDLDGRELRPQADEERVAAVR